MECGWLLEHDTDLGSRETYPSDPHLECRIYRGSWTVYGVLLEADLGRAASSTNVFPTKASQLDALFHMEHDDSARLP